LVYSGCGERDVGALDSVVREQLVWPVVPVELRIWVVSQSLQCTAVWCVDQLSVKGCLSLSVHNERLSDDFSVPSSNRNRRQHLIANTSPQTCDASRSPARSGDALSRGRTAHEPRCEPGDAAAAACALSNKALHSDTQHLQCSTAPVVPADTGRCNTAHRATYISWPTATPSTPSHQYHHTPQAPPPPTNAEAAEVLSDSSIQHLFSLKSGHALFRQTEKSPATQRLPTDAVTCCVGCVSSSSGGRRGGCRAT
jgi:hypothetical protein